MRALIVLPALTFGPGATLLARLGFRLSPLWATLTVAAAVSFALEALVATALAVTGWWSPGAFLAGVVGATAAGAVGPPLWLRASEPS